MGGLISWLDSQKGNGLLLLRIALAVILITAGYGKLFNMGIPAVIERWTEAGLVAAPVLGTIVPILEFFGGIAILLGILTRLLGIWVIVQFALIIIYVHPFVFLSEFGKYFVDISLLACGIILATQGAGPAALAGKLLAGKRWAE